MISTLELLSINKDALPEAAKSINSEDLLQLVDWLSEKDDKIRYQSLLLLRYRSQFSNDVYSFWDKFVKKLSDENSYQRSIGVMLIAENTRWDSENRLNTCINDYLKLIHDEKPITVRQCIQALSNIVPYKVGLHEIIAKELMSLDIMLLRDTMRKLILFDIVCILAEIRKYKKSDDIENYIFQALSGEVLDKKSKKQIEAILKV
jgi:hypothetical protein